MLYSLSIFTGLHGVTSQEIEPFHSHCCENLKFPHIHSQPCIILNRVNHKTASVIQWSEFQNPRGAGFDCRRYKIFCVTVVLQRFPLSLMRINEELLERKVAAPV
jgi:hypothetical protein